MVRSSRVLLASGVTLVLLCLVNARPAVAQQLRGTVVEAISGQAIVGASITLLDEESAQRAVVASDSTGHFSLALPSAGAWSMRVERLGYETIETESFEVAAGELLELRVVIGVQAVRLAPVEVLARSRPHSRFHDEFYRRVEWGRQTGFGRFLTREDIENAPAARTSSLLMRVPFLPLVYASNGDVHLGTSRRGSNCASAVYLNGMQISSPGGIDWLVGPDELEGVEIYRSSIEIPVELRRPGVCTVVSFWTRVGEANQPFSWTRLLIGGTLAAGLLTLIIAR